MHPYTHEFMSLFEGHATSFGTYVLTGEVTEAGKQKGNATSINRPLTIDIYSDHLSGKYGLGVIPINEHSMAKFGAIDIDIYDLDLKALNDCVQKLNLPLMVCRTKSGGAHLYLFLTEWAKAALVQKKLREMAVALGYGTCEIYPRQSQLLAERGDVGNWINLPYFNGHTTMRYGLSKDTHTALKLEAFIKAAFAIAVTPVNLHNMKFTAPEYLSGGPPCLQQLCSQGFPDGTRNNGLFNLGVYAQKAYGEGWEGKLEELNSKFMKPPLSTNEVLGVIKSLKKKQGSYLYTCKAQPIQAFCNAAVCRTCKFGVGAAELGMPKFGTLTKLNTVPPLWFLDVETQDGIGRLELTTEELQAPALFQKRCMEALNIMPMILKRETWTEIIQKLLQDLNVVQIPKEATPEGQLFVQLENFCTSRVQASKVDELLIGKPWVNNGEIHFRLTDFIKYLQIQKFNLLPLHKVAAAMKKIEGFKKVFHNIKGKGVNAVVIPENSFDVQKESFDVPEQPKDIL